MTFKDKYNELSQEVFDWLNGKEDIVFDLSDSYIFIQIYDTYPDVLELKYIENRWMVFHDYYDEKEFYWLSLEERIEIIDYLIKKL